MTQENITSEPLSDEVELASPDGEEAVESDDSEVTNSSSDEVITLAEIEKELGKKFPSKQAALKAWKDTNSYVGKKKEDIEKEISKASSDERLAKLERDLFFANNPQYKELQDVIEQFGGDPAEVVKTDAFTKVYEAFQGYQEGQSKKTVMTSKSRQASNDTQKEDFERAQRTGNWAEYIRKHHKSGGE